MKTDKKQQFFALLHNIRSAHNVGAIFRTAEGAGISGLYLAGHTPAPFSKEFWKTRAHRDIEKTALGAETYIPWEHHKQAWRVIERLKKEGVSIIALEQTKNSMDYTVFKPKFPLCIVVGNEINGLPQSILKRSDQIIEIPMRGKKESLNVSVAFGIAAYHMVTVDKYKSLC